MANGRGVEKVTGKVRARGAHSSSILESRSSRRRCISQTKEYLEELVDQLNANRPVCPVGLNTLVIPRRSGLDTYNQQQPYVYLSCGHVQGHHDWGLNKESNFRTCPMCLKVGKMWPRFWHLHGAIYNSIIRVGRPSC